VLERGIEREGNSLGEGSLGYGPLRWLGWFASPRPFFIFFDFFPFFFSIFF
jgi:hypothetical protein